MRRILTNDHYQVLGQEQPNVFVMSHGVDGPRVLPNRLGVINNLKLARIEAQVCKEKFPMAVRRLSHQSTWTFKQLRMAHQMLLGSIYPWAGTPRKVDIQKAQISFARFDEIPERVERIFTKFADIYGQGGSLIGGLSERAPEEVCDAIASLCLDLNAVHPFLDGNGRSIRVVVTAILNKAGYNVDWEKLGNRSRDFDDARMAWAKQNRGLCAVGATTQALDLAPKLKLRACLSRILTPVSKTQCLG